MGSSHQQRSNKISARTGFDRIGEVRRTMENWRGRMLEIELWGRLVSLV
jgi:hypothetical protein